MITDPTEKQWARQAYAFGVMASKCQAHECKCGEYARELVANCPDSLLQLDISEYMPATSPPEDCL